jgi:hypothetical protein
MGLITHVVIRITKPVKGGQGPTRAVAPQDGWAKINSADMYVNCTFDQSTLHARYGGVDVRKMAVT